MTRLLLSQLPIEAFETLLEGAFDGFAISEHGLILYVNQALAEMYGFTVEEMVGKYTYDFAEASSVKSVRDSVLSSDRHIYEAIGITQGGQLIYTEINSIPFQWQDRQLRFSALRDLTAKKNAEDKLLDYRLRLFASSKMSALGEMASGIAHEINNPLAIIRSYASVLRDVIESGRGSREQRLANVEKIDSTVLRITKIVHSLMGYSRNSDDDAFLHQRVRNIVEDTLELCEARFRQSQIEVKCDAISETLEVECRRVPISQIMLNLLNNAVDAVDAAADAQDGQRPKWVQVSVVDLGEQVEIAVTDNGMGVPDEFCDKIMQPFFTTKTDRQGTGLGLSISKKIAESHQGTLRLDSASKRTRFVLSLPKRQAD